MDDPRLKIQAGIEGDFVLIGFPYHIGAKLEGQRLGQDHGPDCLRRFLEKIGPIVNMEYNRSIEHFVISDYGNIHVINENDLSALVGKLQDKVNLIKSKNHTPIIIGGSRDCSYAGGQSKIQIKICAVPDLGKPYDGDKLSVDCAATLAIQNFKTKIEFFGWNSQLSSQQLDKTNSLQSIRRYQKKLEQDILKPNTQAGQKFQQLLTQIQEDEIHLSFSLEAIDGAYCPGVSRQAVIGLTAEESIEIMLLAGLDPRVRSIDITDYNPTIEDYRSGFLLGNMIYYFIMGRGAPL